MMDPDHFDRQKKRAGTGGLRLTGDTRSLMDPDTLRALTAETLEKARPLVSGLEARVELLVRGAELARLGVPGVEWGPCRHALSPKGEKIVVYVARAVRAKPQVAKLVQVAALRFHQAARVVAQVESALADDTLRRRHLEELKLKCFYLAQYHGEFRHEPVLKQLFPPPAGPVALGTRPLPRALTRPIGPPDTEAAEKARQTLVAQAERLQARWSPRIDLARQALEALEKPPVTGIKRHLTNPFDKEGNQVRAIASCLSADPTLVGQLRGASQLLERLGEQLGKAHDGADPAPLQEVLSLIAQLTASWPDREALREFAPMGPAPAGE